MIFTKKNCPYLVIFIADRTYYLCVILDHLSVFKNKSKHRSHHLVSTVQERE